MDTTIVGFIGFGLIGGSIARALKEIDGTIPSSLTKKNENPSETFYNIAYDYHTTGVNGGLSLALEDGTIDKISKNLSEDFKDCDIIFLCAPVLMNIEYLKHLKEIIKPTCIITDVGSVKGNIHEAVNELSLTKNFIGGHPMTGSERTGYANSNSLLLENAYYILTPTKDTDQGVLSYFTNLIKKMNAIPLVIDYNEHDNITAAISHVPHIIAAQLVNLVRTSDDSEEKMRTLAAGGFKDITRIASSSPIMWQNICLTNTSSIKHFLKQYIDSLNHVVDALEKEDEQYLYEIFDTANTYRSLIPNSRGMMNRIHEIYIDITDEVGAIAIIATLLGSNTINIKNIGIVHNREFEQGVLRIEFYNEDDLTKAVALLKGHNYTLYERS
ncbi:prephenate dehydrogenase [Clostridium sp. Marseille-P299]|uniref:prephenate dehydrogenase n=1 Tax=Clostridium sp. Marseille-P299 TaxID=1805477 RepID=UPI00082BDE87|nr:prephenate dehydrogenase [Clostridium sp. Marseille-P299]